MPQNLRVLLAPDKFKGSLTAAEVADAVATGLRVDRSDVDVVQVPVADGGDGTVAAAVSAGFTKVDVPTVGPTGLPGRAGYAARGRRAVIELADVVGLARLPGGRFDPVGSSTFGLGVVIKEAIDRGATDIVLGLGGSASTDGGAGLVAALGASLTDANGHQLPPGGGALSRLRGLDLSALRARISGVRFAALSLLGAELRPGIELVLELVGFDRLLVGADLVITGEGSLDEQSLAGKAPVGVARAAARARPPVPVVAVAGRTSLSAERLQQAGISRAYPLSALEPDVTRSIAEAPALLRTVGATIARQWLPSRGGEDGRA